MCDLFAILTDEEHRATQDAFVTIEEGCFPRNTFIRNWKRYVDGIPCPYNSAPVPAARPEPHEDREEDGEPEEKNRDFRDLIMKFESMSVRGRPVPVGSRSGTAR